MTPLTLHLHGPARVVAADGRETLLERRAAALCALVALAPGLPRERAALWLWPDSNDARRNLRQQLLRFRQQFDHPLVAGESTLALADGVQLAAADGAELLAGMTAGDGALGTWLAGQREAARQAQREPLVQARVRAEEAGDLATALRHAQQLLALEPHEEAHHTALMRLHYLRGEPAAGLAAWQRLGEMLAAQYGSAPGAASREVAQALRSADAAAPRAVAPRATAALPVTLKRPPVLAGRAAEVGAVQRAWAEGLAVWVEGEAGLGKSRLIAELLGDGAGSAVGAGRPGDAGAPYATLSRLLAPWLDGPALPAAAAAALAPMRGTSAAGAAPASAGALQAAVTALLDAHALHTVVLDDLHFADEASLDLAAALCAANQPPRRWLFACRPAEAALAARALADPLAELQRLQTVRLAPLSEAAAATLVDTLAIEGLQGHRLAPALVRHTGGNPLYLLETLKQGLVDGSLARGELPRPGSVGALIERRLQRLSEPALTLARVAAVGGVDFCLDLAVAAIGQPGVQLASAWNELQEAQVLRDEAFAHDLVHDAVLRTVAPPIARHLHVATAQFLEARGGEAARTAAHWAAAERWPAAATAWRQAALRARSASRRKEELQLLQQAAEAHARAGDAEGEFEALLEAASAVVYVDVGAQADAIGERLLAAANTDLQRTRALNELAFMAQSRGDRGACERHAREALELAERLGRPDQAFYAARSVAVAVAMRGQPAEALALIDRHRDWVEAHGSDENRCEYHSDRSWALGKLGRLHEAREALELALALAEKAQNLGDVNSVLYLLASVEARLGRTAPAMRRLERAIAMHEQLGNDSGVPNTQWLLLGALQRDAGRYDDALRLLGRAVQTLRAGATVDFAASAQMALAQAYLDLGRPELARQAMPAPQDGWIPALHAMWQHRQGRIEQALGRPAVAHFEAGLQQLGGDVGGTANNLRAALVLEHALALRDDGAFERVAAVAANAQATQEIGLAIVALAAAAQLARENGAALSFARQAQALLADSQPESCPPSTVWLALARTFQRCGDTAAAERAAAEGAAWVRRVAAAHVPDEFRAAFVDRQPVNRELLAFAARLPSPAA